jgi:MFS family permease
MNAHRERPAWSSLVLILGLAGLIVMADNWVVSPILPSIASAFGVPVASTGVLIAAYMLPFGLFQLAYGPLADRYGKFRTVVATLTLFAGVTALGALMPSVGGLAAVRGLTGVFAAATMPVSLALLGDSVPMVDRQKAIGTFMGIAFLGQGISMILGGVIAFALGWRWVFALYGLIAGVIAVVLWTRVGRFPAVPPTTGSLLAPYRALLGRWRSARVYVIALAEGILVLGLFSFLGALLSHRHGLNALEVGMAMTAFGVAAVVFGRLSGKLAERVGRVNLIAGALVIGGVSGVALAGVPLLPVEVVAIFGLGAGFMLAHSSILTIATELAAHHRGVAMSLVAFAFMGGGSVGTMLAGRVIDSWGFETYLLGWGLALVLLGIAARFMMTGAEASSAAQAPRSALTAAAAAHEGSQT